MTIKELSLTEERRVLLSLVGVESLGHGSSRVTYDLDESLADELGLDASRDYVVKLAVGRAGLNQMALEVNTFDAYGDRGYFAAIAALGQFCEIMEKVRVVEDIEWDTYDSFESLISGLNNYDDEDTNDNYTDAQKREMWEAHSFLNDYIGWTADNCQLGITEGGRAVSYDYGFDPNADADDVQLSSSSDRVANDTSDYYIGRIVQVVDEALTNGQEHIEENFLGDFMENIDEEMSAF